MERVVSSDNVLPVLYVGDQRILEPMCVSAFALMTHLNPDFSTEFHVLHDGWSSGSMQLLGQTLGGLNTRFSIHYHKVDLSPYAHLPAFHGSRNCYALLHAGKYVNRHRLLCLDYDTLPLMDISALYSHDLAGYVCAGVCWNETAETSHESKFYEANSIPDSTPIMNSGVVPIDTNEWENQQIAERCMRIAKDHSQLVVGDQSLINAALQGSFAKLPWKYNVRLGAAAAEYCSSGIAHFVGKPKPWSLSGKWRHSNYHLWRQWSKAAKQNWLKR